VTGNTGAQNAGGSANAATGSTSFTINTHTHPVNLTSAVSGPAFLTANVFIKT
jgi:hypothetical protein